jgi:hypothetical protein
MTPTIRIDLTARPQRRAYRAIQPHQVVCLPWGRGGGKSKFLRLMCYLLVAQWDGRHRPGAPMPGVRVAIVMPTLTQARKVHQALLLAELAPSGEWGFLRGTVNKTELRIDFPGGSWIQFVSAEAAQNNRGIRCDVIGVDEADDVDPEVVDAVSIPWFSEHHSLAIRLIGGTPKRGRFGLLYRTHARALGRMLDDEGLRFTDHHSFHATCYDFPQFVSPRVIATAKREVPRSIFNREWLCDFDSAEGLVYGDVFSESFHVRDPAPGTVWNEIVVGGDHGWEDPAVLLVIGIAGTGADATAHVIHEVYAPRKDDDWWLGHARQIHDWFPSARWYFDPSRPDRISMFKTKVGVRLGDVDNAIEDGVGCVARLLVRRRRGDGDDAPEFARLYVARSCTNTIREFGTYKRRRDPRNVERILDDIEDKNNHAMDALRYPLFARFRHVARGRNEHAGAEARQ